MSFGSIRRAREWRIPGLHPPREEAGAYLTDGARLFRVVAPLCSPGDPDVAVLEDCMTLAMRAYTAEELWGMGLTVVKPARRRSPSGGPARAGEAVN